MELLERVAICETEIENVKDKIEKQDKLIDSIYDLASGQKELNTKMDNIEKDLSSVKRDVKDIQLEPGSNYKKILFESLKWIILFGLGYLVNMVVK